MKKKITLVGIILVIAVLGLVLFSPLATSVKKPALATSAGEGVKPPLAQSISSENVNWAMNEVGTYKLNDGAQIEVLVDGVVFTTSVSGHVPSTIQGAGKPDVRFFISAEDFQDLYSSNDMTATAKQLYGEGKLSIELKKGEVELALKGYKALYDELQ